MNSKKKNLKSFLCGFGTGSGNSLREFLMSKAASQLWVTGSNVNQVSRDQNLSLQLKKLDPLLSSDTHFAMGNNNMTSTKAQDGNRAWIITVTEYPSSQHLLFSPCPCLDIALLPSVPSKTCCATSGCEGTVTLSQHKDNEISTCPPVSFQALTMVSLPASVIHLNF